MTKQDKEMLKTLATIIRKHSYLLMLSNKEMDTLDAIIDELGGEE